MTAATSLEKFAEERCLERDARTIVAGAEAARDFIAGKAAGMQEARRLDDEVMETLVDLGAPWLVVGKHWGGAGGGLREATGLLRSLARADFSVAWNFSIYMANALLVQRMSVQAQEEVLGGDRPFLCSGHLAPSGSAEAVPGGFRLQGRWPYASGVHHASYLMLPSICDGVPRWFLVPKDQVTVLDDWFMSGLAASGSSTVVVQDVFVPEHRVQDMQTMLLATGPGSQIHDEPMNRAPFYIYALASSAMPVGALESAVEDTRDTLSTSRPFGVPRIQRPGARRAWVDAAQISRMNGLLLDHALDEACRRMEEGHRWSIQEQGQMTMDGVTIVHGAKTAMRMLLDDVGGSSAYRRSDALQRRAQDVGAMSTHLSLGDYHTLGERAARWMLGMDPLSTDPLHH